MSLRGDFSTFPLPELLEWLGRRPRSGLLRVCGTDVETSLVLHGDRIAACASSDPPNLLGQFLLFHGVISEAELEQGMADHRASGARLGEVLLRRGTVSSEVLEELLRGKAQETVLSAFDHPEGTFEFDPDAPPPDASLRVDMRILDAAERGAERVAQAASAIAILEQPGTALRRTGKPATAKIAAVWPLRRAYMLVDGERTIAEIALHLHGTRSQTVLRLYQLFTEGFIGVASAPIKEKSRGTAADVATLAARRPDARNQFADGSVPIAVPRAIARGLGGLTTEEKYLLTCCDGSHDVSSICAVAALPRARLFQSLSSLAERGLIREEGSPEAAASGT